MHCRAKWGTTGATGNDCREVEVVDNTTGKPRLKQEPFQGYNAQLSRQL
jgi:hypothetical protein